MRALSASRLPQTGDPALDLLTSLYQGLLDAVTYRIDFGGEPLQHRGRPIRIRPSNTCLESVAPQLTRAAEIAEARLADFKSEAGKRTFDIIQDRRGSQEFLRLSADDIHKRVQAQIAWLRAAARKAAAPETRGTWAKWSKVPLSSLRKKPFFRVAEAVVELVKTRAPLKVSPELLMSPVWREICKFGPVAALVLLVGPLLVYSSLPES